MLKNIFQILAIFILGTGGGALVFNQLGQRPVYVTETKEIIVRENTALENAVEKAEKAVIGVRTKLAAGEVLKGSGLIVTSDGLIVTLADLVPQGAVFSFYVDESPASYQILKRDLKENLALIKVGRINMPTLSFADLEKIRLGERVFLVGTGAVDELRSSSRLANARVVNEGIIRSFDKNLIETNIFEDITLAGSPLFNIKGEVLGINTIGSAGRVMAIPVSKIKKFIGL